MRVFGMDQIFAVGLKVVVRKMTFSEMCTFVPTEMTISLVLRNLSRLKVNSFLECRNKG